MLFVEALHQVEELGAGLRVEVGRGLIGEDQRGPRHNRARDGDALLLAAGQEVGTALGVALEADPTQGLVRELAPLARVHALKHERVLDILDGRQHRDQVVGLEHETEEAQAEIGDRIRAERGNDMAVVAHRAFGRLVERADHIEQGGFPRA